MSIISLHWMLAAYELKNLTRIVRPSTICFYTNPLSNRQGCMMKSGKKNSAKHITTLVSFKFQSIMLFSNIKLNNNKWIRVFHKKSFHSWEITVNMAHDRGHRSSKKYANVEIRKIEILCDFHPNFLVCGFHNHNLSFARSFNAFFSRRLLLFTNDFTITKLNILLISIYMIVRELLLMLKPSRCFDG